MTGAGVLARWRVRLTVLVSTVLLVLGVAVPPGLAVVRAVAPDGPAVQAEHPVPVSVVKARPAELPARVARYTPETRWPAAGTATVSLAGATAAKPAAAGALPVKVSAAAGGVSRVRVSMASHAAATALGVTGTVLTLARADRVRAAGKVRTVLDYASWADAYGGDYASRLRLVGLPACALTTPKVAACREQTPLVTVGDVKTKTLTATVTVTEAAVVVAASSTPSGSGGNYTAPVLPSSGEWTAGGSDGAFDYSYPVQVPKVPGGLEPDVALEYDSQLTDGLTSSTNNQASWVGDGWDYSPGYVERDYQSCETAPPGETKWAASGDLCWSKYNQITLSLNGQNTVLVNSDDDSADDPADGTWHPQVDDGERVSYVTGGDNGTHDGGYWVITTEDGTSYYFGRDEIANYASGDTATDSAWTVPVYATSSGQPGYSSTTETAESQAWRWNLDYVTDRHGDAIAYFYDTEDNYYDSAVNSSAGDANETYVQGGVLSKIEYGLRAGEVYGYTPAGEVTFTTAADRTDIPSDLSCTDGDSCDVESPTFWDKYELNDITTYARDGSDLDEVDTWALDHENLCLDDCTVSTTDVCDRGAVTGDPLWLSSVTETAEDGTAIKLPATTFCGDAYQNRIESEDNDGYSLIYRNRLTEIVNDTGGVTTVNYDSPSGACVSGTLPDEDANTLDCYPDFWTESGVTDPVESWFNKYVVASVTEEDTTGDSPDEVTQYTYSDPAWHYDDNPLIPSGQRTWDQWRGFKTVTTETGTAAHPDTETVDTYFQGMDGDHLSTGDTASVTLTSDQGQTVTDSGQYAGIDFEHVVHDGPGGATVTDAVTEPWTSAATADASMPSPLPALESYLTGTTETLTYTALASGGDRESTLTYTHDSYGRVTKTSDVPDTSDASEDTCTTTSYATSTTFTDDWILDLPSEVDVTSVPCGSTAALPADAVSDIQTSYDDDGNVTKTQEVTSYTDDDGTEDANWTTESTATYDEYGRVLDSYDADNRETITTYSPSTGSEPSKVTVEDPMTLVTTTTYDPLLDVELSSDTPQGWTTTWTYDALGRVTAEWTPGHSTSGDAQYKYSYVVSGTAPSVTTTATLEPDGTDYLTSEVLYDSFGRERETQDENADGNTVVTDTSYDADGRKSLVSNAYYISGVPTTSLVVAADDEVPSQTGYDYDGAGRETAVISYELATETSEIDYAYGGDYTTTTYVNDKSGEPDGGTPETVFTDGRGLTTAIYQYHSEADAASGPGVSAADYDATSYTYYPSGKLDTIQDAAGNKWSYIYDLAGDETSASSPDTGTTTKTYDAAGQLLTTTDARDKEITYSYNLDGQKTEEYDTTDGSEIASWAYSDGELTSSSSYAGGDAYTVDVLGYNGYGLPEGTETSIPAGEFKGDYTQKLVYNAYDDQESEYEDTAADGLPQEITDGR